MLQPEYLSIVEPASDFLRGLVMAPDPVRVPVFGELTFSDASSAFEELGSAIEGRLSGAWWRDRERESDRSLGGIRFLIFRRRPVEDRPAVGVFVTDRGTDLYVSNIVPAEAGQISRDEYNETLREFAADFAVPAAQELGIQAELTPGYVDLSKVLEPETYAALVAFSRAANRSTGSSHPMDQSRWFEFIWRLHESGRELGSDVLAGWLEEDGWSPDAAAELAGEFEYALSLLNHRTHG